MNVMDLFGLRGKRALITGASSGIGRKVAQAYAQAGADVAIAARTVEALESVAGELAADGGAKVMPIPMLRDPARKR